MEPRDRLVVIILAGGSGTRLWPRSRQTLPKQFLDLTGQGTMLQETYGRLQPLVPPQRIFVITNDDYVDLVRRQLPDLPPAHAIGEPVPRGTAAAVGLGAVFAEHIQPDAIMASVHADHLILKPQEFREALEAASEVAATGPLVTLGIEPTSAHTGLGYVEQGELLMTTSDGHQAFRVARFTEKPNRATAERFAASGRHSWNSGLFAWRVDRIMAEFVQYMPELHRGLRRISDALGTAGERETLEQVFPGLPRQTIDYGIMERAVEVAVLPVDIGWTDIGSWATLLRTLESDEVGNVIRGQGLAVTPDTRRTLVYSAAGRLVATLGVEDLIIVDTEDAVLVCSKDKAQDVRRIVDLLQESSHRGYL